MKRFSKLFVAVLAGIFIFGAAHTFADEPQGINSKMQAFDGEAQGIDNYLQEVDNDLQEVDNDHSYQIEYENTYNNEKIYYEYTYDAETAEVASSFLSFTGEVKEIAPFFNAEGQRVFDQRLVTVENENHGATVFRTDYNTLVLGDDVKIGDNITAWFSSATPTALVHSRQHVAHVIINDKFENVKVDRFHFDITRGALVSADGQLALNFNEETPILSQDGQNVMLHHEGYNIINKLNGRILAVIYGPTDRMMPGGTIPNDPTLRIVLVWDRPQHSFEEIGYPQNHRQTNYPNCAGYPDIADDAPTGWTSSNRDIFVNNHLLAATWRHIDNIIYLPFRPIVEALGFGETVAWDGDNMMVSANNGMDDIHFPIGTHHLIVGQNIVALQHPVILRGGITYVPWQFFRDAFGADVSFNEGLLFINTKHELQH